MSVCFESKTSQRTAINKCNAMPTFVLLLLHVLQLCLGLMEALLHSVQVCYLWQHEAGTHLSRQQSIRNENGNFSIFTLMVGERW